MYAMLHKYYPKDAPAYHYKGRRSIDNDLWYDWANEIFLQLLKRVPHSKRNLPTSSYIGTIIRMKYLDIVKEWRRRNNHEIAAFTELKIGQSGRASNRSSWRDFYTHEAEVEIQQQMEESSETLYRDVEFKVDFQKFYGGLQPKHKLVLTVMLGLNGDSPLVTVEPIARITCIPQKEVQSIITELQHKASRFFR